jgi:anti-sigma B factor antagonist
MGEVMSTLVRDVRHEGGAVIVVANGEIDLRHTPDFHKALADICTARPEKLIIHLGDVSYMDSSGVGTLVEIFRRMKDHGGRMMLVAPTERVRSLFEITRLDRFFAIFATEDEALSDGGGSGT